MTYFVSLPKDADVIAPGTNPFVPGTTKPTRTDVLWRKIAASTQTERISLIGLMGNVRQDWYPVHNNLTKLNLPNLTKLKLPNLTNKPVLTLLRLTKLC